MKCTSRVRGRFTVTEELSPRSNRHDASQASSAQPGVKPSAADHSLASIPERVPSVVKRGRFSVFTSCLSCDSTLTKYDELDDVCQPFVEHQKQEQHAQADSPLAGLKFIPVIATSSSSCGPASVSTPIRAVLATPGSAARDVPVRWRDQDSAFVDAARSSCESASSCLSSTLSMDSCRSATKQPRRVRFSEPGADCTSAPAPAAAADSAVTSSGAPSPRACAPQQSRTNEFLALLNSGSIAQLPRSVTKCYQRGRFMVEEGVLSPCLSGSNVITAPATPAAPMLQRSPSMPVYGSSGSGGCAVPMEMDLPVRAPAATGCADLLGLGSSGSGKEETTPHAVSFMRRGRFLVQTYL